MKVIFLDVDGVLNSEKDLLEAKGKSELFDRPLALLKELVESTKAKIVVSSTWRIGCLKVVVIRGMERKSSKHLQIDWQNIRWKYMILHQS